MRRLASIIVLGALLVAASAAAAPSSTNQARLDSTVRYLQEAQNADGGFGGFPGAQSGSGITAWVALALAAAGINPQDQAKPGGVDVHTYLVNHFQQGIADSDCAPIACTTMFERELMVANVAGTSPHDFGGVDLVAELLARKRPDGSFPHVPGGQPGVNDTIFAIFALAPVGEPAAQGPIQRAADWIEAAQHANGGWAWSSAKGAPDEVDMTGAAIQALVAAGREDTAAELQGLQYLRDAQNPDGGFPEFPGNEESNVASTAWAVQAIWAAGENPETWLTESDEGSEEPLDYMASLQEPDGHIRWKRSQDMNGVWMTAYAAPAFAGQAWPIPAAPRSLPAADPPTGDGVPAGGGDGAPLFSRPKPQSKGRTPGGARVLNDGLRARNHSRSRRGDNTQQPTGTAAAEALHAEEGVTSVSGSGEGSSTEGSGSGAGSRGLGHGGGGGPRASTPEVGEEISGTVIGDGLGQLAFGAPGLRGAGSSDDAEAWVAAAICAGALLLGLGGAGWERRQREVAL